MIVTRQGIANTIYKKLGKTIPKLAIHDIISIVCSDIGEKLSDNEVISVFNFGTMHTYDFHGHKGVDIYTGDVQYVGSFKHIKFLPHDTFQYLIEQRKSEFK